MLFVKFVIAGIIFIFISMAVRLKSKIIIGHDYFFMYSVSAKAAVVFSKVGNLFFND